MGINISIGILAHNEEDNIEKTLNSLFNQSLLNLDVTDNYLVEVIVAANGCTDSTVKKTKNALTTLSEQTSNKIDWRVCEIETPGKSNAWNCFVHNISKKDSKYLILMDADIEFLETDSLLNMVACIEKSNDIWVVTSKRFKDIFFKKNKNILEKLSIQASNSVEEAYKHSICGQLYCARTSILRKIWMPKGLPVEDGFLRAMILTNNFTSNEELSRIQIAPNSSHVYKAINGLLELINHEKRIVVGDIINSFLFDFFWEKSSLDLDAGKLVLEKNLKDSDWLKYFISEKSRSKGKWLIPKDKTFRRFERMRKYSLSKKLLLFPAVCLAFFLDLIVFWQANETAKQGDGVGFW